MDGPEAPIELSPDDPSQLVVSESVRAEYGSWNNKNRLVLGAAVLLGALALSGCNNQNVEAEVPDASAPTTSEVTPTQEPEKESKYEAARDALIRFQPDFMPSLTNFSMNSNHEQGLKDAERYLHVKDSKVAFVNFSQSSPEGIEEMADTLEEAIPGVTAGTVKVEIDVVEPSDVTKQLYKQHNQNHTFNPDNVKNFGSVIAAAVMPELNEQYDVIIAFTDSHFPQDGTMAEQNGGQSVSGGKYADIMMVAETEPLTTENRTAHEFFHALGLQHAKTVMNESGDFGSAYPYEPGAELRANLAEFLSTATVDEYGGANIMGDDTRLFDTPPLTTVQLYTLGAAERMLDVPYVIHDSEVTENNPVIYNADSSVNAIALYNLDEPLQLNGRDDQSLNGVFTLALTPHYDEEWKQYNISFDGITYDNGSVNFMNMQISNDPSQGHKEQVIDLPDGKSLRVSITPDTNELQITAE